MTTAFDFEARTLHGEILPLREFTGKVLLIVNTASQCGFTPQYEQLEALYERYRDQGLVVLGFPCNQFGAQEPGAAAEIEAFCQRNYGVSFPMFDKIDVNADGAHPLFRWLQQSRRGLLWTQSIKWNFTKFLVNRAGEVTARYSPTTKPQRLSHTIEALLKEPAI